MSIPNLPSLLEQLAQDANRSRQDASPRQIDWSAYTNTYLDCHNMSALAARSLAEKAQDALTSWLIQHGNRQPESVRVARQLSWMLTNFIDDANSLRFIQSLTFDQDTTDRHKLVFGQLISFMSNLGLDENMNVVAIWKLILHCIFKSNTTHPDELKDWLLSRDSEQDHKSVQWALEQTFLADTLEKLTCTQAANSIFEWIIFYNIALLPFLLAALGSQAKAVLYRACCEYPGQLALQNSEIHMICVIVFGRDEKFDIYRIKHRVKLLSGERQMYSSSLMHFIVQTPVKLHDFFTEWHDRYGSLDRLCGELKEKNLVNLTPLEMIECLHPDHYKFSQAVLDKITRGGKCLEDRKDLIVLLAFSYSIYGEEDKIAVNIHIKELLQSTQPGASKRLAKEERKEESKSKKKKKGPAEARDHLKDSLSEAVCQVACRENHEKKNAESTVRLFEFIICLREAKNISPQDALDEKRALEMNLEVMERDGVKAAGALRQALLDNAKRKEKRVSVPFSPDHFLNTILLPLCQLVDTGSLTFLEWLTPRAGASKSANKKTSYVRYKLFKLIIYSIYHADPDVVMNFLTTRIEIPDKGNRRHQKSIKLRYVPDAHDFTRRADVHTFLWGTEFGRALYGRTSRCLFDMLLVHGSIIIPIILDAVSGYNQNIMSLWLEKSAFSRLHGVVDWLEPFFPPVAEWVETRNPLHLNTLSNAGRRFFNESAVYDFDSRVPSLSNLVRKMVKSGDQKLFEMMTYRDLMDATPADIILKKMAGCRVAGDTVESLYERYLFIMIRDTTHKKLTVSDDFLRLLREKWRGKTDLQQCTSVPGSLLAQLSRNQSGTSWVDRAAATLAGFFTSDSDDIGDIETGCQDILSQPQFVVLAIVVIKNKLGSLHPLEPNDICNSVLAMHQQYLTNLEKKQQAVKSVQPDRDVVSDVPSDQRTVIDEGVTPPQDDCASFEVKESLTIAEIVKESETTAEERAGGPVIVAEPVTNSSSCQDFLLARVLGPDKGSYIRITGPDVVAILIALDVEIKGDFTKEIPCHYQGVLYRLQMTTSALSLTGEDVLQIRTASADDLKSLYSTILSMTDSVTDKKRARPADPGEFDARIDQRSKELKRLVRCYGVFVSPGWANSECRSVEPTDCITEKVAHKALP